MNVGSLLRTDTIKNLAREGISDPRSSPAARNEFQGILHSIERIERQLPKKTPRIAIAGNMRSGKTTLARALSERLGLTIHSFANPLKHGLELITRSPLERSLLQEVGSLIREHNPDNFVNIMRDSAQSGTSGMIIDDVRFPNELLLTKELGFFRILLDPGERVLFERGATPEALQHESEKHISTFLLRDFDLFFLDEFPVEYLVDIVLQTLEAEGFDCSHHTGGGVSDLAVGTCPSGAEKPLHE